MALKLLLKRFLANERRRARSEKGLALILVLSLIVVVISVVAEIIFQSEITSRVSVGERDKAKAEMAAMTGAQFAKMVILLDTAIANRPAQEKAMMAAMLGDVKFYNLLDNIPLGNEAFSNIEQMGEAGKIFGAFDENFISALKEVPGYFVIKTSDESAKLNVNLLGAGAVKDAMKQSILRLFSTPREARFLEDKKYPPARLVANLMDYVDKNKTDELDGSDEDNQYNQAKFTHKAKNGPLESIEELRRIPGFHDDEIFRLFSPYLTVWPMTADEKSLNINTAPVELLGAIVTQEGNEPSEQNLDKVEDQKAENKTVSDSYQITDFFDNVLGAAATSAMQKRLATTQSHVFRVEVRGVSNGVERTYLMILDRSKSKNTKAPPVRVVFQRFL